jgi:hypothetical protein
MKNSTISILVFIFHYIAPTNTLAQIGDIIMAGQTISQNAKKKKALRLTDEYTHIDTVSKGALLSLMRVPPQKIKSQSQKYIESAQSHLDAAYYRCKNNQHNTTQDLEKIQMDIERITIFDPDWVTKFYNEELQYYQDFEYRLTQQERQTKERNSRREQQKSDSINHLRQLEKIRLEHNLKLKRDSIARAYNDSIARTPKIVNIRELNADQSSHITTQSETYPSKSKTKSKEDSNPKTGRRYDGHTYRKGPRGGCFYINADGNKIYVDKSYCK